MQRQMPNESDLFGSDTDLLACPACGADVETGPAVIRCLGCSRSYPLVDGIPLFYYPHEQDRVEEVTEIVREFYESNPFPNYDDLDSRDSLTKKARHGKFARLLDEQIPDGGLVLEAGCGTGQLSNFLGMSWRRRVFGVDICLNSLRLAAAFSRRNSIKHVAFMQMNLFRPAFREQSFDVVISNGVLHHTNSPLDGFRAISRLVKPGGHIIVGLYNTIGRLTTDLRRALFNTLGDRFRFVDPHMRHANYNETRKQAWFMDQYKHPRESKHSFDEILSWFDSCGFDFTLSIPKIWPKTFQPDENLFGCNPRGTRLGRLITQAEMLARGGEDGALFIMIGRNRTGDR